MLLSEILPIETDYDYEAEPPQMIIPDRPPFDGKLVWLVTEMGIVKGRWIRERKYSEMAGGSRWACVEHDFWLCFDDQWGMELEQPLGWFPLESLTIPS